MSGGVNVCLALAADHAGRSRAALSHLRQHTHEELAVTDWDDTQKAAFLQMQFDAQHRYYMENYRDARFQVIEWDRAPVGRLYLVRWPDEIRIIDIALLPEYRGQGLGTHLLRNIQADARASSAAGHHPRGAFQPGAQPLRTAGLPHG